MRGQDTEKEEKHKREKRREKGKDIVGVGHTLKKGEPREDEMQKRREKIETREEMEENVKGSEVASNKMNV